jgi:uncharacterized protein
MTMTDRLMCIYHKNCADGFGAAWSVRAALGEDSVEFFGARYGDEPPDVNGRKVVIVDFSYKRDVLEEMARTAEFILILDHHKSAEKDLDTFRINESSPGSLKWVDVPGIMNDMRAIGSPPILALFDMNRSGAGLAWDVFHDDPRPNLLNHIEDRDLWRFSLKNTKAIQACLFSYPFDFDVWDKLMDVPMNVMAEEGRGIERKHMKDVRELIASQAYMAEIDGHRVPVLNAPHLFTSEAGNLMSENAPFAACYWDTEKSRVFSLRSREDGMDVSVIASKYGGGGHVHAAHFRLPRGEWPGAEIDRSDDYSIKRIRLRTLEIT